METTSRATMQLADSSFFLAQRAINLPEFRALAVYRDAIAMKRDGRDVYHLEVGQPEGKAPQPVIKAAQKFLNNDPVGYTESLGTFALRSAISRWYKTYYDQTVDPERIVITIGSSGGFVLGYLSSFDPGAVIASPVPGYPCYRLVVDALGYQSLAIQTDESNGFCLTADMLHKTAKEHGSIQGLVLGNPANPTGSLLDENELNEIAEVCKKWNIRLFMDEVYHGLTYGKKATSLAANDQAVILNSFSKYFCMTGWRIGWLVAPEELIPAIEKVAQNLFISASSLSQHAATHAFDCVDELDQKRQDYAYNRSRILNALQPLGFRNIIQPDGGLYVYAQLANTWPRAQDFTRDLLRATGVALTPGNDFDPIRGDDWVRLSFCATQQNVDAALVAMKGYIKRNS